MILVDTSVWVDHLRMGKTALTQLLQDGQVATHPFIIGEIALGNLKQRNLVLGAMHNLPHAAIATYSEVLHFVEQENIFGHGIGYIDAHLLASVRLSPGTLMWTRDKRLYEMAAKLGLAIIP